MKLLTCSTLHIALPLSANCDKSFSTGTRWTYVCLERIWYLITLRTSCTITVLCGQRKKTSECDCHGHSSMLPHTPPLKKHCWESCTRYLFLGKEVLHHAGSFIGKYFQGNYQIIIFFVYFQVATKCSSQWALAT